jgi:hypothetical protein
LSLYLLPACYVTTFKSVSRNAEKEADTAIALYLDPKPLRSGTSLARLDPDPELFTGSLFDYIVETSYF